MMRTLFFVLMITLLSLGCGSSKKLIDKGKYKQAYSTALSKLNRGKSTREDKQVLNEAFNKLYNEDLIEIARLEQSTDLKDLETAYKLYDKTINRYNKGKSHLDRAYANEIQTSIDNQEATRLILVDQYWSFANQDLLDYEASQDKAFARSAYQLLTKVEQYDGVYPDLNALKVYAYESGIIKVGFDVDVWFALEYDWEAEDVFEELEGMNGFVQFIFEPREQVDCFLEIDLEDLDFDERISRQQQQVSKTIQDGYTTETDDEGNTTQVPKYVEVQGTVIAIITEVRGQWTADVDVNTYSNACNFRDNSFRAEAIRTCEYYEYEGDPRAMPNNIDFGRRLDCDFRDELVDEMLDVLFDEVSSEYQ